MGPRESGELAAAARRAGSGSQGQAGAEVGERASRTGVVLYASTSVSEVNRLTHPASGNRRAVSAGLRSSHAVGGTRRPGTGGVCTAGAGPGLQNQRGV